MPKKSRGRRFDPLLAVNSFEPCAGCIEECVPEHCAKLSEWIFSIVMNIGGEIAYEKAYLENDNEG